MTPAFAGLRARLGLGKGPACGRPLLESGRNVMMHVTLDAQHATPLRQALIRDCRGQPWTIRLAPLHGTGRARIALSAQGCGERASRRAKRWVRPGWGRGSPFPTARSRGCVGPWRCMCARPRPFRLMRPTASRQVTSSCYWSRYGLTARICNCWLRWRSASATITSASCSTPVWTHRPCTNCSSTTRYSTKPDAVHRMPAQLIGQPSRSIFSKGGDSLFRGRFCIGCSRTAGGGPCSASSNSHG